MNGSVILNDPIILAGFLIALSLFVLTVVKKLHCAVAVVAAAIFVSTMCYALLKGVDLYEAGAVAAVFAVVGLIPLWVKKEK